jgi:cell division protein FtsI (penicillin-binding protein 3)
VVAASIFQRIGDRWSNTFPELARRRVASVGQEAPQDTTRMRVPPVEGQPAAIAASRLRAEGYDVRDPDGSKLAAPVERQRPSAGSPVDRGSRVVLAVASEPQDISKEAAVMPDLRGLSARQAVFWLSNNGVQARVEGHGRVIGQWPEPGAELARKVKLRCR